MEYKILDSPHSGMMQMDSCTLVNESSQKGLLFGYRKSSIKYTSLKQPENEKITWPTSVFSPRIPTRIPIKLWWRDIGFNWMHFWARLYILSNPWFKTKFNHTHFISMDQELFFLDTVFAGDLYSPLWMAWCIESGQCKVQSNDMLKQKYALSFLAWSVEVFSNPLWFSGVHTQPRKHCTPV